VQGIIIFAAVNAAFLVFIFFFFKARIDRRLRSNETLQVVREEINELIVELNQTTNRNVEIIEERIESLKEITQRADKRIGLLTKEIGKKEKEAEVYTSLKPKTGRFKAAGLEETGTDSAGSEAAGSDSARTEDEPKAAPPARGRPESDVRKEGTREKVLALYKNGISPDIICKELDITLAEVELIISLNRNRGAVG
jgi:hypothetical protein